MAICSELNPLQEMPIMPTLPFDHGWCASQEMICRPSACSCSEYSRSVGTPSLVPKPRMSTRAQT